MTETLSWHRRGMLTLAVLACLVPESARLRAEPLPPVQATVQRQAVATTGVQAEEVEFTALLQQYYAAVTRKDIAALERLWHSSGPARSQRNLLVVDFELRDVALEALSLSQVAADAGGGRARVVADLTITTVKTLKVRHERRVRDLTFLPDAGTWKIWNEASAGDRLAQRLLEAPQADRDRLIASEPELVSDDALTGLTREVTRLRSQGMSPRMLDVLALQGRLARAVGNTAVLARSRLDAGLILQVTGNVEAAASAFGDAREAYVEAGDTAEVAACDNNLGNVAYLQRNYDAAFEYYQAALGGYELVKDESRAASLRHSLGNVHVMRGDFERALESYQLGLAVFGRTADTYAAARVLQAMGRVHKELGNYGAAADVWGRCVELSIKSGDTTGAATALHTIGDVRRQQGDVSRALESYTMSLALWDKTPDVANRAATMYAIGQAYVAQRTFTRGVDWYLKALELDQKAALDAGIARDLGGLGGAHLALGQPAIALEEYRRSLALREKLKDTPGVIWTLIHMGVLHAFEGRHQEALTVFDRGLQLAESERDLAAVCTVTALRARSLLTMGDVEGSLPAASRATEVASGLDLFDVVAHARVTAGRAHRLSGRADEARVAFEEALAALDRVSADPGTETFFSDRRGPYLAMVDLLVSENKGAEAFLWSERLRQRALADLLGSDGLAVTKGLTPAERDDERRLSRESRALAVRIRRERARVRPDGDRLAALQEESVRFQSSRNDLRRALFEAHPALATLRARTDPLGVEGATGLLADLHTALLSFVVSEARTWVFVFVRDVGSGHAALQQVATLEVKAADLAKAVDAYVRAVVGKADDVSDPSRALRTILLEPVQAGLTGTTRLVVVPDAFLWSVPFEALQDAAGRYLIEDVSVSYGVSVTALSAMGSSPLPRSGPPAIVAVANPLLQKGAEDRVALLRSASARLPDDGEREARAVGALFAPAARRVLVADAARARRVLREVSSESVLHLVVPVFASNANPLFSMLALTPSDATDADGGLVEMTDVLTWDLPAQAVVITRLESGGAPAAEEGLAGLSWSFFVAGVPTMVANRWELREPGAEALVPSVYRSRLAAVPGRPAGRTMAEAIQRAAKRQLAQPATKHPYYWAGLVAIGR